jgi:CheY-like chemotaxis protein
VERQISALVVSEDTNEAALVRELIEKEFDDVRVVVERDESAQDGRAHTADILVLAFRTLSAAEEFYLGFYRNSDRAVMRSHGAIVLCTRDEARDAYRLCRRGLFDDYVVFWPASMDASRLAMAAYTVIRRLQLQYTLPERASSEVTQDPEPAAIVARHALNESTAELARASGDRVRVLVVDDDAAQRKLIGRFLERTGMELSFASGGSDALRSITQSAPGLLLLDLNMPTLDGVEVLRRLRALPGGSDLPVIVVTGSADRESVRSTLDFGVVDFIVKPFDRETLLSKVRRAIGKVELVGLQERPSAAEAGGS